MPPFSSNKARLLAYVRWRPTIRMTKRDESNTVEYTRLRQNSNLKCICKLFKADMNTDIPLETATISFKRTFI